MEDQITRKETELRNTAIKIYLSETFLMYYLDLSN